MTSPTTLLMFGVLFTLAGCSGNGGPEGDALRQDSPAATNSAQAATPSRRMAPGYSGMVPSSAGQAALSALVGKRIKPVGGSLGTEELVVGEFGVIPNPITGKGPVILLQRPGAPETALKLDAKQGDNGRYWLPIASEGDVADFVRRVTGSPPANLSGPLSEEYTKVITGS